MITATEAGKRGMNSKPLVGLQRPKEYKVHPQTGLWAYTSPYKHKIYNALLEHGEIDFADAKLVAKIPECEPYAYYDVRDDMRAAGILLTKEEAKENRRIKAEKELAARIKEVQEKGEAKMAAKTVSKDLVGPELHAPIAGSTGVRNGTVMEAALRNSSTSKPAPSANTRLSPDAARIKTNLETYSLSQLKALNLDDYKRQKGHYPKSDQVWYNHRRAMIQRREKLAMAAPPKAGQYVEAPAQPQQSPIIPTPVPQIPDGEKQKAIKILLTLPIDDVQPEFRAKLKEKIKLVFSEMTKGDQADAVTIVTLDDPTALEIRKVVYY